ncbi:Uma2 family endonuclease [Actinoplanes sp. OR16]|uniref:Uma2 family endonuclease n=1 Tax=Actinoplanes sp. OR16 TaxID=946334 RepID=UPI001E57CE16|nr:Uma2 family endonuclease [Actinoplanes sp. OR16]
MSEGTLPIRTEPWTEENFFALGETPNKIELVDGSLWVSPSPNGPHQDISLQLGIALKPAARTLGLRVRLDLDVRLQPGTILRPDLIVVKGPRVVSTTDVADVLLVSEVISPGNATADRLLKRQLYAAAGIKWYLLVEPDMPDYESLTLRLLRLKGDAYVEHAVAASGTTLTLDDPLAVTIDVDDLLDL